MPARSKPPKPPKPPKPSKHRARPKPPSVPRPTAPGSHKASAAPAPLGLGRQRSFADWPVHEALVNRGWDDPHSLAVVYVVRRHPRYESLAVGTFLVDLKCLGVKDANYHRVRDGFTYVRLARPDLLAHMPPMMDAAPALAAKIVAEGLAYAASLGFEPHPDFQAARGVLDGLDPADDPTPIPVGGIDGKPHYISGPHDDPMAIVAHLRDRLGKDGYDATLILGDPDDEDFDEPEWLDDLVHAADDGDEDEDEDSLDDASGDVEYVGHAPLFIRCRDLATREQAALETRGIRDVPDGDHLVVEYYCTDPRCDCRRALLMIVNEPDGPPEALIGYSWADDAHLLAWMGTMGADRTMMEYTKGPVLEIGSPNGPTARALLKLVHEALLSNPEFIQRLQSHYDAFRAAPPLERAALPPKRPSLVRRLLGR